MRTESLAIKKEIEIRGRYLMMACDIEFCLLNIIMFCNPDPHNHERVGQFKRMSMSEKINNVISDLKKYKLAYYKEFKTEFDGLEEFRCVRNDMAHHRGGFPDKPDLMIFRVTFIDVNEAGIERLMYKDYTDQYNMEAMERFKDINAKLMLLWLRLKSEYDCMQIVSSVSN